MRIFAAKSMFADLWNRWIPEEPLYCELVRALYGTPKSMIGATAVALLITMVSGWLAGDTVYYAYTAAFLVIGVARSGTISLYRRTDHASEDLASVKRWETSALVGAWAFAGLVGCLGAYTIVFHAGTQVEILVNGSVIGYIAGVSSRNASRPLITIGQISATCIPFSVALVSRLDAVHITLAVFITALHVTTVVISSNVYETILSRHRAQRRIEKLALRDFLTDLWNRSAFLDILGAGIGTLGESKKSIGLISIDLDRFKDINDTLGHPAGDAVLREAADRLRAVISPLDSIARIGGDEFLVMVTTGNPADVDAVAHRIAAKLAEPSVINLTQVTCRSSVGYAIAPKDGGTLDDVMRHADLALYAAKGLGGGHVVAYTTNLSLIYEEQMTLVRDLRTAFAERQLELFYQPIVDARTGRTICCEALLRWNHPQKGAIPPSVFIPIAEKTGMIIPIGAWVLEAACKEAARWTSDVKLAVNLSPLQFRLGRELIATVLSALSGSGLPPHRLDLEVTESVLIDDAAETLAIIEEIRRHEIGVSLDDFGTGYSSLSYLHRFPFSKIKLDRKFSQDLGQSSRAMAIVKGVAQITRDLDIELVAEGVETAEQLKRMQKIGIRSIQGYLFSRPVPVDQIRLLLRQPFKPPGVHQTEADNRTSRKIGKSAA